MKRAIIFLMFFAIIELTLANVTKVGFNEVKPFASSDTTGFTLEYWNVIARELNLNYKLIETTLPSLLDNIRANKIDVGAAAISITHDRESSGIDFSHPYFNSGLGIVIKSEESYTLLKSIFNMTNLKIFLGLLLYVIITGHLIWWSDKDDDDTNDAFNDKYIPGIFESYWWTVVTMSTVGYGDFTPRKWGSRILGIITIFVGIGMFGWVFSSMTTASVSDYMNEIKSVSDLDKKTIVVKQGSTSFESVKKYGGRPFEVTNLQDGILLVANNEVDAMVGDWPTLYELVKNTKLELLPIRFDKQYYGFAFPENSALREQVNRAHLKLVNSGEYDILYKKYFDLE